MNELALFDLDKISQQMGGVLARKGILERDEDDCMDAGGRTNQEPEPKAAS